MGTRREDALKRLNDWKVKLLHAISDMQRDLGSYWRWRRAGASEDEPEVAKILSRIKGRAVEIKRLHAQFHRLQADVLEIEADGTGDQPLVPDYMPEDLT